MNRFRQIAIAALAALTLGMVACTKPVTTGDDSLYNRLGALAGGDGKAAITVAVDKFLEKVVADDRINFFFANANVPRLRAMLIDQVCEVSGGPCKYTGGDMVTVHKGMNVTESQFIALVEDLRQALVEIGVPIHEMNELVGLLAPLKRQITYNGVEAGLAERPKRSAQKGRGFPPPFLFAYSFFSNLPNSAKGLWLEADLALSPLISPYPASV